MTPDRTRRYALILAAIAIALAAQIARWRTVPTGSSARLSTGAGREETGAILIDRLTGRSWYIYEDQRTPHNP